MINNAEIIDIVGDNIAIVFVCQLENRATVPKKNI